MSRPVWRAFGPRGENLGERKLTKNTDGGYAAVLYDPRCGEAVLWSGSVESAERERRYALRRGRELAITTDVRLIP